MDLDRPTNAPRMLNRRQESAPSKRSVSVVTIITDNVINGDGPTRNSCSDKDLRPAVKSGFRGRCAKFQSIDQ